MIKINTNLPGKCPECKNSLFVKMGMSCEKINFYVSVTTTYYKCSVCNYIWKDIKKEDKDPRVTKYHMKPLVN